MSRNTVSGIFFLLAGIAIKFNLYTSVALLIVGFTIQSNRLKPLLKQNKKIDI